MAEDPDALGASGGSSAGPGSRRKQAPEMPCSLRFVAFAYAIVASGVATITAMVATVLVPLPGVSFFVSCLAYMVINAVVLGVVGAAVAVRLRGLCEVLADRRGGDDA